MPIDPSIPLQVQPNRLGEIFAQFQQQKRSNRLADQQNTRQNRLIQLKEEQAENLDIEKSRKSSLKSTATFLETTAIPMLKDENIQGVDDAITKQIEANAGDPVLVDGLEKMQQALRQNPTGFARTADQTVSQARFEKLIPSEAEGKDIFGKANVAKFTPESIAVAEQSGRRSDLRLREGLKKPVNLSPSQKAVDREFSKVYVPWVTGGFADAQKNLIQLDDVSQRLGTYKDGKFVAGKENLTGPILGRTPDVMRAASHPASLDVRDNVEEVVQRNLRLILGAQFTQREGERLIARAYNENLSEEVNKKRLDRLIQAMRKAAQSKQDAAEYFEENGTLSGFKGQKFNSVKDVQAEFDKKTEESSGFQEGQTATNAAGDKIIFRNGKWQKQ